MQCPNCHYELRPLPYNGIDLLQCINCEGIWFNQGKLRATKDNEDELLQWLDVDLFSDPKQLRGGYSTMICPNDQESLYEISYDTT